MTFGIPMDIFPIGAEEDELVLLENHREWVSQRRQLEALENDTEQRILVPGPRCANRKRNMPLKALGI